MLLPKSSSSKVNEPNSTASSGSPGETLSRRCVALLKTALRPDVWPGMWWSYLLTYCIAGNFCQFTFVNCWQLLTILGS